MAGNYTGRYMNWYVLTGKKTKKTHILLSTYGASTIKRANVGVRDYLLVVFLISQFSSSSSNLSVKTIFGLGLKTFKKKNGCVSFARGFMRRPQM
jgi:hypothetical protein